ISDSETPKSRLEMSSLQPLSTALPAETCLLEPPKLSSNLSCCHLSGNSLGCGK
ncbi:hypothetical protein NQD34_000522, partial [Periophthalmus magnuspinnatus]